MAELVDTGVACREIASHGNVRAQHQFERVLRRIAKADQVQHAPLLALFFRATLDRDADGGELLRSIFELTAGLDLEPDDVVPRLAGEVADVMIAFVAAQVRPPALA